jgi:hypothetical protein
VCVCVCVQGHVSSDRSAHVHLNNFAMWSAVVRKDARGDDSLLVQNKPPSEATHVCGHDCSAVGWTRAPVTDRAAPLFMTSITAGVVPMPWPKFPRPHHTRHRFKRTVNGFVCERSVLGGHTRHRRCGQGLGWATRITCSLTHPADPCHSPQPTALCVLSPCWKK